MPPRDAIPVTQLYQKLEIIGKGSYGAVYRGREIATNNIIAIKVINLDTEDDDVGDIQREVNLLSQLRGGERHNITMYYGCYLEGPRVWIIMDYASGGSVRTLMKATKGNVIEERFASIITRECLVALSFLHKSGVIHRDLKAANLLITDACKVVLCDFGVSALLTTKESKRMTFVGTPHWMAPEVITSGSLYDSKADMWSLGVTIYEMVTGGPPHGDQLNLRAIALIPKAKAPRLPEAVGSKEEKEFVASCLKENPSERPGADELMKSKWIKMAGKNLVLRDLLKTYENWTRAGGVRASIAGDVDWDDDAAVSDRMSVWEFDALQFHQQPPHDPSNGTTPDQYGQPSSLPNSSGPLTAAEIASHAPPRSLRALFDDPNSGGPPAGLLALGSGMGMALGAGGRSFSPHGHRPSAPAINGHIPDPSQLQTQRPAIAVDTRPAPWNSVADESAAGSSSFLDVGSEAEGGSTVKVAGGHQRDGVDVSAIVSQSPPSPRYGPFDLPPPLPIQSQSRQGSPSRQGQDLNGNLSAQNGMRPLRGPSPTPSQSTGPASSIPPPTPGSGVEFPAAHPPSPALSAGAGLAPNGLRSHQRVQGDVSRHHPAASASSIGQQHPQHPIVRSMTSLSTTPPVPSLPGGSDTSTPSSLSNASAPRQAGLAGPQPPPIMRQASVPLFPSPSKQYFPSPTNAYSEISNPSPQARSPPSPTHTRPLLPVRSQTMASTMMAPSVPSATAAKGYQSEPEGPSSSGRSFAVGTMKMASKNGISPAPLKISPFAPAESNSIALDHDQSASPPQTPSLLNGAELPTQTNGLSREHLPLMSPTKAQYGSESIHPNGSLNDLSFYLNLDNLPAIEPLDYSSLLSINPKDPSTATSQTNALHSQLMTTVDNLSSWLGAIDMGLGKLLSDADNLMMDEDERSSDMVNGQGQRREIQSQKKGAAMFRLEDVTEDGFEENDDLDGHGPEQNGIDVQTPHSLSSHSFVD